MCVTVLLSKESRCRGPRPPEVLEEATLSAPPATAQHMLPASDPSSTQPVRVLLSCTGVSVEQVMATKLATAMEAVFRSAASAADHAVCQGAARRLLAGKSPQSVENKTGPSPIFFFLCVCLEGALDDRAPQ